MANKGGESWWVGLDRDALNKEAGTRFAHSSGSSSTWDGAWEAEMSLNAHRRRVRTALRDRAMRAWRAEQAA